MVLCILYIVKHLSEHLSQDQVIQYQSGSLMLKGIILQNGVDTIFYFQTKTVELQDVSIGFLEIQLNAFRVQANQINLTHFNVTNRKTSFLEAEIVQNCENLAINNSQFTNNTDKNSPGGVIYAVDNKIIKINNSSFQLNLCNLLNDGSIHAVNNIILGILQINQTQLQQNKATSSSGGAIHLQNINLIIYNSLISSNQAQIGGGIYYKTLQLGFWERIIFKKIQLLDEEENPIKLADINSTEQYQLSNDVQALQKQIIIFLTWEQTNGQIQCIGQLQTKQLTNGGFDLDAQIFFQPISTMTFTLMSNLLPQIKDSKGNTIVNEGQIQLKVNLYLVQCSVGEIFKQYCHSIACQTCPDGKYSLSLNDSECKICPDSALSCQGNKIQLKNSYWRKNEYTDKIQYCNLNPLPCKSEFSTSKFNCDQGYKGPLSQSCDTYGVIWGSSYSEIYNRGFCYRCLHNHKQKYFINSKLI
ncbi:hypothetical protein ABPG72_002427 [Tetrahymena utriculariae]